MPEECHAPLPAAHVPGSLRRPACRHRSEPSGSSWDRGGRHRDQHPPRSGSPRRPEPALPRTPVNSRGPGPGSARRRSTLANLARSHFHAACVTSRQSPALEPFAPASPVIVFGRPVAPAPRRGPWDGCRPKHRRHSDCDEQDGERHGAGSSVHSTGPANRRARADGLAAPPAGRNASADPPFH